MLVEIEELSSWIVPKTSRRWKIITSAESIELNKTSFAAIRSKYLTLNPYESKNFLTEELW